MADMFDYLRWRGDILFAQLPPNPVDALIFSTLTYIRFDDVIPDDPTAGMLLADAARVILGRTASDDSARLHLHTQLMQLAAESPRFAGTKITFFRSAFDPEEQTQFAAVTFLLDDGSAFLAFRGTDSTLIGWKEDFNMSFRESVPAQRMAVEYTAEFAGVSAAPLQLCGHSKGGNLAVYAAANSSPALQARITQVYNQDGPGFTEYMMGTPGYLAMVPKIRTYVPQSSVIGMLMDHEEPYTVVKSTQIGLMQHDPYSWEVLGADFVTLEERTADSWFFDRTFKNWLAGMTIEERNAFFDALFALLSEGDVKVTKQIVQLKNLRVYWKTLQGDEEMRRVLLTELHSFIQAARKAQQETEHERTGNHPTPAD